MTTVTSNKKGDGIAHVHVQNGSCQHHSMATLFDVKFFSANKQQHIVAVQGTHLKSVSVVAWPIKHFISDDLWIGAADA